MANLTANAARPEGFSQVCVWPETLVGPDNIEAFVEFMKDELGVEVAYLEEFVTGPSRDSSGCPIPDTGGRNDVIFALKDGFGGDFAIKRLGYGIKWIEDSIANDSEHLYPARLIEYKSWMIGKHE